MSVCLSHPNTPSRERVVLEYQLQNRVENLADVLTRCSGLLQGEEGQSIWSKYANTAPVQQTELMVTASFTLNCTPSAANPPVDTVSIEVDGSPVTSGDTVIVTDNVLAIPSVQRSHSGNYSCNATNTRGSAVIFHNLLVIGVFMQ